MGIIISKDGRNAQKIEQSAFQNEDYLQNYIYENPESIPLYEIDENIRLLILAREFPTNSGPIDALGIDLEGEIYLVETKLYKNPDKRLVVAQVLDYGAALSFNYRDFGTFLQELEAKVNLHFKTNLNKKVGDFFGLTEEQVVVVIENIKSNLNNGKFRFVVLMDELETRLKDLIVFLNQNSRFTVYAVELEYYKYNDFEILIPRIYGSEVKKEIGVSTSTGTRRQWDEETFFQEAAKNLSVEEIEAVKKFYDFSKMTADKISWGTGSKNGSFSAIFNKVCPRSIYSVYTNGTILLNFRWMDNDEKMRGYRDKLRIELNTLLSLSNSEGFPAIPISDWENKTQEIINVIESIVKN